MSLTPNAIMKLIVDAVQDKKAYDVVTLDVSEVSLIADYFIICHGNSETQVQAIVSEARKKAHEHQVHVRGLEGTDSLRWVLLDLGDVVLHVFHRDDREYYNIERIWSDAKLVELI